MFIPKTKKNEKKSEKKTIVVEAIHFDQFIRILNLMFNIYASYNKINCMRCNSIYASHREIET